MPLVNNRIDVKDERDMWLEARVLEIFGKQIKIHYKRYASKFDEWIELPSE